MATASLPAPLGIDPGLLLSSPEKRQVARRLLVAMLATGMLLIAELISDIWPDQADLGTLVGGLAAMLVAYPVLIEAWHALRHPNLHGITDLLVCAAMIAAWGVGDLKAAALVPLAMTIGHILEERSMLGTRDAIAGLARLTRTRARRLGAGGAISEVESEELQVGERVDIRPGDRVPADGVVIEGRSSIDMASITGESVPVEVQTGGTVHAGTVNHEGHLVVEVVRTGRDTTIGQVMELMRKAESAKPPITRLLERFAGAYLVLVLLIAGVALFLTGSTVVMMTTIDASCPCALVLAAPATAIAAIAVAARHGVLIKSSAFLEELSEVDTIIFDKTGTLTLGELRLVAVQPQPGVEQGRLTRIAGSLGAASSHPVSRAIAGAVPAGQRLPVVDLQETPGFGLRAQVDGTATLMGRRELLEEAGIALPGLPEHNGPLVGVAVGQVFQGWLLLADEPRPEARQALEDLRALGLRRQILLTGDRAAVAGTIASTLGIEEVEADATPARKLDRVLAEIALQHHPLVVGDGINDALALKAGAIGVAMGATGTDVALASSDVVLTSSDLHRLATCVRLSRACRRAIAVNVGIGLGWTALVMAGGITGAYGPLVAILLHNVGTLAVLANAGRLLSFDETSPKRG